MAYGLTIANLYYCQPLLPEMARAFGTGSAAEYLIAAGQLGYALALMFVVPLGDITRRRQLVRVLLCAEVVALAVTAAAPTAALLLAAGAVIGLASAGVVNVLVAHAAGLATGHERGRAVATMLSGGLAGILLSRTVAGLVSEVVGWRVLFIGAALVTSLLVAALSRVMEPSPPDLSLGYGAQLRATVRLVTRDRVLRRRSFVGAGAFAAFGCFWATVAYRLSESPYHYGPARIGLLALAGAAGALAARYVGRAADRGRQLPLTRASLTLGVASFAAIWAGGEHLSWLLAGLTAMDLAVQATHLLNMSVVYGLVEGARARVASVYMTIYTLGGVAGSTAGAAAYPAGGWTAVCLLGAAFMTAALAATFVR